MNYALWYKYFHFKLWFFFLLILCNLHSMFRIVIGSNNEIIHKIVPDPARAVVSATRQIVLGPPAHSTCSSHRRACADGRPVNCCSRFTFFWLSDSIPSASRVAQICPRNYDKLQSGVQKSANERTVNHWPWAGRQATPEWSFLSLYCLCAVQPRPRQRFSDATKQACPRSCGISGKEE